MSASELAKGVKYENPITTSWRPPSRIRHLPKEEIVQMRRKKGINVEGENVPYLIESFAEMKFPHSILSAMKSKDIVVPTVIQMQGIPVALSGRDMIGIASTGSGKTLTFVLPIVMFCLEQELMMRFNRKEGPYGLVIVPSRELAKQIYDVVEWLIMAFDDDYGSRLRIGLAIGGNPINEQSRVFERSILL